MVATLTTIGCGGQAPSLSPRPAASASVLPGLSPADRAQDPAAYRAARERVVEVFLKNGQPAAAKLAMAQRIAAMPEVEAYHFVSKAEALRRFGKRFGERIVANLPINPLPASFEILVHDPADLIAVAKRFYHDPMVDNDPGTHDAVRPWSGSILLQASPAP